MKLTYLATPYTHADKAVMLKRFEVVNRVASELMRGGKLVFSPISHTHPIALAGELPTDWHFWKQYDHAVMKCCGDMVVLRQDGWRESVGVNAEIQIAQELDIPVTFIDP